MEISQHDLYLNLGCYDKPYPKPFINVDLRPECNPDVVDNLFELNTFIDGSAQEIVCIHALEHVSFFQVSLALKRWYEVLQLGGRVRISVPDLHATFAHYFYWGDLRLIRSMLYGSQRGHAQDYHLSGWDKDTLTEELELAGFKDIQSWNYWEEFPNNYLDDYSKCVWPPMQYKQKKARGDVVDFGAKDMSLNLVGFKK